MNPLEVFRSWNMACPVKSHHLPRWFPAETSMASQLASTSRPQWPGSTCFFPPRQHEEHLESREFLGWSDAQQREWWIWWMVCDDGTKWWRNYGISQWTPCNYTVVMMIWLLLWTILSRGSVLCDQPGRKWKWNMSPLQKRKSNMAVWEIPKLNDAFSCIFHSYLNNVL